MVIRHGHAGIIQQNTEAEWIFYFLGIVKKFLEFTITRAKDYNVSTFLINSIGL